MPWSVIPWSLGAWNESRHGFFDLDERYRAALASRGEAAPREPLAPRPVYLADLPIINATAVTTLHRERLLEKFTSVWREACTTDAALFVDSGCNEGAWSLLAAAHGCRVLSVDPQPQCAELVAAAANTKDPQGTPKARPHPGNTTRR